MDIGLKGYCRISKIKEYNRIFKISVSGVESHFLTVSGVNAHPMEGIPQVDF